MSRFEQQLEELNREHFRFGLLVNIGCLIAGAAIVLVAQAVANS